MYADKRTYSGGTPLTTSFAETAASILFSSAPTGGALFVISTVNDAIALTFGNYKIGETPSSTLPGRSIIIPPAPTGGIATATIDPIIITKGAKVYVRAITSSQTSGSLYFYIK